MGCGVTRKWNVKRPSPSPGLGNRPGVATNRTDKKKGHARTLWIGFFLFVSLWWSPLGGGVLEESSAVSFRWLLRRLLSSFPSILSLSLSLSFSSPQNPSLFGSSSNFIVARGRFFLFISKFSFVGCFFFCVFPTANQQLRPDQECGRCWRDHLFIHFFWLIFFRATLHVRIGDPNRPQVELVGLSMRSDRPSICGPSIGSIRKWTGTNRIESTPCLVYRRRRRSRKTTKQEGAGVSAVVVAVVDRRRRIHSSEFQLVEWCYTRLSQSALYSLAVAFFFRRAMVWVQPFLSPSSIGFIVINLILAIDE